MRIPQLVAASVTAAILGTSGVAIAGAATSGASSAPAATTAATSTPAPGKAAPQVRRRRVRRLVRHAIGLSAKTIHISRADLVSEMRAGKTVADVASEHGVKPQTVIDALVKAGQGRLDKAKAGGKLNDARYQRLEQRLPGVAQRFVTEVHTKKTP
jgi:hypothetical protein